LLIAAVSAGLRDLDQVKEEVTLFDRIDKAHGNSDGLMDIDELMVWHGHKHTKSQIGPEATWRATFRMQDQDGDGKLTREEFHMRDHKIQVNHRGEEL
jgi:Ca2+-binding EF-hand superfamily protein